MRILEEIKKLREQGYDQQDAEARLWQDTMIQAIAKSTFSKNVTVKGGVVMRSLANNVRRATRDLDIDFICYSIGDEAIEHFVKDIDCLKDIRIKRVGEIEELSQQDYHGKRVHVEIRDEYGQYIVSKIDLGVHKDLTIEQEEYCFDISFSDEGVCIYVNSKEQMFTEKLCSLLKFGIYSTRYKDIYDMCYLSGQVDSAKLLYCFHQYIFENAKMKENCMADVYRRVNNTFRNDRYKNRVATSDTNWIDMDITAVFQTIEDLLKELIQNIA